MSYIKGENKFIGMEFTNKDGSKHTVHYKPLENKLNKNSRDDFSPVKDSYKVAGTLVGTNPESIYVELPDLTIGSLAKPTKKQRDKLRKAMEIAESTSLKISSKEGLIDIVIDKNSTAKEVIDKINEELIRLGNKTLKVLIK